MCLKILFGILGILFHRCSTDFIEAPAIGATSMMEVNDKHDDNTTCRMKQIAATTDNGNQVNQLKPGTLPDSAGEISNAARSLLKRLLDPDPKVRLKNIRQLQQTAFYMGFNFEHVKAKKISPKTVLERHGPSTSNTPIIDASCGREFQSFDEFQFPL